MNGGEFIQTCSSMGYSSKKLAKKYVEKNQKDTYDMDDIIIEKAVISRVIMHVD